MSTSRDLAGNGPVGSGPMGISLAGLVAALDEVSAADVAVVDDAGLRQQILDLLVIGERVQAELVRCIDVFDRRGGCEHDGFRTTKAWLLAFGRRSAAVAHRLVKVARLLRRLPGLATAAQSGAVGVEQVQLVARLADRVGHDRVAEVEPVLVDAASQLDLPSFGLVCDRVLAHLDPDGAEPDRDFERRALTLSPSSGMVLLRGQLDAEGGAALLTALDAVMSPPSDGDQRTPAQRRADALVELARRPLVAGTLPGVGGQRPQVGVLVHPQALSPKTLARLADRQRDVWARQRLQEFLAGGGPSINGSNVGGSGIDGSRVGESSVGASSGSADLSSSVNSSGSVAGLDWTRPGVLPNAIESAALRFGREAADLRAAVAGGASPDSASPDGASPDGASPDGASLDSASPDTARPDSPPFDVPSADTSSPCDATTRAGPTPAAPRSAAPRGAAPSGDASPEPTGSPAELPAGRTVAGRTVAGRTLAGRTLAGRTLAGQADGTAAAAWARPGWNEPPWLNWVGPVPAEVAQRIACDADVFRIVMDPDSGLPLDVGRSHRLVPHWMRRALQARDRGCRWTGCTAPGEWSDAHHLDWWADGGRTSIDRCLLLCRFHHGLVHEGGWSIDLDRGNGRVSITRPSGLPYVVPGGDSTSWNGSATRAA